MTAITQHLIIVLLLIVFWISGVAVAEDPATQLDPALKTELDELTARLGLDEEQQALLFPLQTEYFEKRRELMEKARSQGRSGMRTMREEMMKLDAAHEEKLAEILSEDQLAEYRKYRDKKREERRHRRGGRGPR
jgi:hypothetical protein